MTHEFFVKRQTTTGSAGGSGDYEDYGISAGPNATQVYNAWFSTNGVGARYGTAVGIIVVILLAFLFAYFHGLKKLHEGSPLLFYHRWMFNTRHPERCLYWGNRNGQNAASDPLDDSAYAMDPWHHPPTAPPAYHENIPPVYQPPSGASKVVPNQNTCEVHGNDASNNDNDNGAALPSSEPRSPTIVAPAPTYLR